MSERFDIDLDTFLNRRYRVAERIDPRTDRSTPTTSTRSPSPARGRYWFTWGINFRAVTAMAAGVVVGLLFETTTIFSGPLSASVGGVDLSFTSVGVTAGLVYLVLLTIFPEHDVVPVSPEPVGGVGAGVGG